MKAGAVVFLLWLGGSASWADTREQHNGIDKVYDPYVEPLEREIELRGVYQNDDDPDEDGILHQRLGFGASLSERVFAEVYALGKRSGSESFRLEGYELEAKIQLTEQGEFSADWGLLLELEQERSESITELSTTVLTARQWGRWVGTLNVGLEYEFGSDIDNELETFLSAQLRYRYQEYLEPALEVYADEFTRGVGPVLAGLIRGPGRSQWHWEAGLIFPLNHDTPDRSLRFLLEFEF